MNAGFVLVEAGFGFFANSLALLADAGHNLSDVLGLLLAWSAHRLAKRAPSGRFTYGLKRSTILAALFNASFLLLACGGIAWEAIGRLQSPVSVFPGTVIGVAAVGILVNGLTAWLFASGREHDLNIRGAYLHMVTDAGVSLGVVISGIIITYTGKLWVDPLVSLAVILIVVVGTWSLFRESLALSLDAVPHGIDLNTVREFLTNFPQVTRVHDLHIWGMSTTEAVLTAHLVASSCDPLPEGFVHEVAEHLHEKFGIAHVTLQIERETEAPHCRLVHAPNRDDRSAEICDPNHPSTHP